MQSLIRQLLAELGEDPTREGLLDTPKRVEKALKFLTSGYDMDVDEVLNGALFTVEYSEMVIVKDIDFYSLCEHHLLPFFGKCHVAYIPRTKVIGLSKIPRLVDIFAQAPADSGAPDQPDCGHHPRENQSAGRGGGDGGDASLHVDARRREAELVCGDQLHAGRVPRQRAHADGVSRADQAPERRPELIGSD